MPAMEAKRHVAARIYPYLDVQLYWLQNTTDSDNVMQATGCGCANGSSRKRMRGTRQNSPLCFPSASKDDKSNAPNRLLRCYVQVYKAPLA
jgi:hypothetical protein